MTGEAVTLLKHLLKEMGFFTQQALTFIHFVYPEPVWFGSKQNTLTKFFFAGGCAVLMIVKIDFCVRYG